jgi:hypothetical protein
MAGRPPHISPYERSCCNCAWFDFNAERFGSYEKARRHSNRECLYKGKLEIRMGACKMWKDMRTPEQIANGELVMKSICGF